MHIGRRKDNQNVVYVYNGILLSLYNNDKPKYMLSEIR